jgi:amino acid adenylation domain-containing protein/thioester reductase-like protein
VSFTLIISPYPDGFRSKIYKASTNPNPQLLFMNAHTSKMKPVHQLIEQQAEQFPHVVAIEFEQQSISYGKLNFQANQLAHYLRECGVGPGVFVSLCLDRSLEMFVGLLAVLKSGGTYIPLDPAYPIERLEYMLEDSQASVLLTHRNLDERLQTDVSVRRICLDHDAHNIAGCSSENLNIELTVADLAYIIYTSGSTGKPKGVQIKHGALVNLLHSMQHQPGICEHDTLLAITTISFDLAVPDLYLPLIAGAKIRLISRAIATDPRQLSIVLSDPAITFVQATPSTWRMVLASGWKGNPYLKILCGGEALSLNLANQLLSCVQSLWNMYGPTETTVWSMFHQVTTNCEAITLGQPIANTQIYLLNIKSSAQDDTLVPVSIGEPGELYIGGDGVALGYLNRSQLNQEKFIADPFHPESDKKLYRTGDLARYRLNGQLELIGRVDNQIKVRGHRIELGEIEAALSSHPAIQDGAVIAPEDTMGSRRLLAYVVPKPDMDLSPTILRDWLSEKLPSHMLPNMIQFMDALPLTPNHKIDRQALPVPRLDRQEEIIAPRTNLETRLVKLWSEVLGIEVGISQNFLECGGDSLRVALLVSRINADFEVQVPLACFFKAPTVKDFAPILETIQTSESVVDFQMTPAQLQAEAALPVEIQPKTAAKTRHRHLFITGATGFIGAFLIQELLLQHPNASVYCLIRAKDFAAASERLRRVMKGYEIWEDHFSERIIPILGDLEKPLFGLAEQQFQNLADQIDVIYHSGAYVNLIYPYSALRAANVGGTLEVLKLATIARTIPVHYISTIDVFHAQRYNGCEPILETDELSSAEGYFEGYAQTKWVAEKLVMAARDRGLPTVIYRLGMITGHSQTGASQLGNIICRMMKGFIQLGNAPELDISMVLAPVDYVVQAIVALSHNSETMGQTFHIVSPHRLTLRQLIANINELGYSVGAISDYDWSQQLLKMPLDNALTPAIAMFQYDEQYGGTPIKTGTFVAQTHQTDGSQHYLESQDISCPALTQKTIQSYLEYFTRQDFLTACLTSI